MQHFEVLNGGRTTVFDGTRLASSSSRRHDSLRWVEFNLYLTAGGQYVFERVGRSRVYHGLDCAVVRRNKLKFDPTAPAPEEWHVSCDECRPSPVDDLIVERPRHYALVSEAPDAIIEAAHKYDRDGARYLTNVTRRLIEEAALVDQRMDRAYRVEYIR